MDRPCDARPGRRLCRPGDPATDRHLAPVLLEPVARADADPRRDAVRPIGRVPARRYVQRGHHPRRCPSGRKPPGAAEHRVCRRRSGRHRRRAASGRGPEMADLRWLAAPVGRGRHLLGRVDGESKHVRGLQRGAALGDRTAFAGSLLVWDGRPRARDHLREGGRPGESGHPCVPDGGPVGAGAEAAVPCRRRHPPHFRPAALDPSSADMRQLGAVVTYSDAPPH